MLAKIIKITVQDAQLNYVNDDKGNNFAYQSIAKIDPYVKLVFQGQKFQTNVAEDVSNNPIWKEGFQYIYDATQKSEIVVEVWNKNLGQSAPDFIGMGKMELKGEDDDMFYYWSESILLELSKLIVEDKIRAKLS